jgi:8-oxo-dGTP diphosphatase
MGTGSVAQVVLTVDVVILCQTIVGQEIMLIERGKSPYQGQWALPGGKLDVQDATLEDAACREVWEETGVVLASLQQIGTFGNAGRDSRGRYVSVLYGAWVSSGVYGRAGDDAVAVSWFPLSALPSPLAFDHDVLLSAALGSLLKRWW